MADLNNGEKRVLSQECKMPFQRLIVKFQHIFEASESEEEGAAERAMEETDVDIADFEYGLGRIALRRISMAADVPANAERVLFVTDPTTAA